MDSEKQIPLPWAVQFLAAAMIVVGVMGLCNMLYLVIVADALLVRIDCLVAIWIGCLLLRRNEGSRLLTFILLIVSQVFLTVIVAALIVAAIYSGFIKTPHDPYISDALRLYLGPWWGIVLIGGYFVISAVSLFLILTLRRAEVKEAFVKELRTKETKNWIVALVALGIVLGVWHSSLEYHGRQLIQQIRGFDAHISAVDSRTKEAIPVRDIGISGPPTISGGRIGNFGFKPRVGFGPEEDGWHVFGNIINPFEVGVTVEGYEPAAVSIGPGTKKYVVELKRAK